MLLIFVVGAYQVKEEPFPFKVDTITRIGQFFAIIFSISSQSDILTSIRCLIVFWRDPIWDLTILGRSEEDTSPQNNIEWMKHVFIPNSLKLTQGTAVQVITFILILQSNNNFDLFKDFTALLVISETDNIVFGLAANGYLGQMLQLKTSQIRNISLGESTNNGSRGFFLKNIRLVIFSFLIISMVLIWIDVIIKQEDGTYFKRYFPNCQAVDMTDKNLFQLAKQHFGDGECYGGSLNTLGCKFEGGDCVEFNLAYPLCKGNELVYVQKKLENELCDIDMNIAKCDYDGGQCCPLGIMEDPSFGDGICNGGISSTIDCAYDSGDCDAFRHEFPDCPLDQLWKVEGSSEIMLGNGICEGTIYSNKECGWEYGDCDAG